MKQIEVKIMGQAYLLAAPDDGQERLLAAVQRVDAAMCKIRDAGKIRARDRIAVLAALNLAFELGDQASPGVPDAPAAPLGKSDQARLRTVLARLDEALGDDGQLL